MRVEPKDLVKRFQGDGALFENFAHDLICHVVRSCGVDSLNHVVWDFRTNVADGGRDLEIRIANPRSNKAFYPQKLSVWSMKSGDDGIKPSSLKSEIRDHPNVRARLAAGWAYVWCAIHPSTIDRLDELKQAATEIAAEFNFDPNLIEFRTPVGFADELNLFPNLIPIHLPAIGRVFEELMPLHDWGRELKLIEKWVDFGERNDVIQRVTQHFLSRSSPNVLHIAGLSGIGKTRTVFQACQNHPELRGAFYIERFEQIERGAHALYRYLQEDGRNLYLVIDETALEHIDTVKGRLAEYSDRVRVVTIGPAKRQTIVARDDILVLTEPDIDNGVLGVVRAAGPELANRVQESIARWSGQDLRLALLLVRASIELAEFRGVPIEGLDGVWNRIMRLFSETIGDPNSFRNFFEILTASLDVGLVDDVAGEVDALSTFFGRSVMDVLAAASRAEQCGLGIRTRRFFEASPRALAAWLFESRVWPSIKDRLDLFYGTLLGSSDRLARKFIARCQDCSGSIREEVRTRLGDFFLRALRGTDITVLATRAASRLFQEWAEFDPARGLEWLRGEVNSASPDVLGSLDGNPDGSGGWRGRRQLVWLCQNLASFAEHFEDCEAILFKFALYETEPSIGNNSTLMWQSLYWPGLGGTSMPFDQRLPILMRRLRAATVGEIPLVLSAAVGAVEHRNSGLPMPSPVVGGRVAPDPWRPKTWKEFRELRHSAAQATLDVIGQMLGDRRKTAARILANQFHAFVELGLLRELKTTLTEIDEQLRPKLVADLERYIHLIQNVGVIPNSDTLVPQLKEWLAEVSKPALSDRVRALTIQDYWSTWERDSRDARYEHLADELIGSPEIFRGLGDWLGSAEAKSGTPLVGIIGRRDEGGCIGEIVHEWLRTGSNQSVVASYLGGIVARVGNLPREWLAPLNDVSAEHPAYGAEVTAYADVSINGFDRLIQLVDRLPPPASRFFRYFAFGHWLSVLQLPQRKLALEKLSLLSDSGDERASAVGMDLIRMWEHVDKRSITEALAPIALALANRISSNAGHHEVHNWYDVLLSLAPWYPRQVSQIMIDFVAIPNNVIRLFEEQFVAVISRAASADSEGVMEVLGAAIVDPKRRAIFGILVIPGLFEMLGVRTVSQWVDTHGVEFLPWLARHFKSPYLNEGGKPVLPPLTEWLFREHESNQKAFDWFCMGRSARAFFAADVDPARKRQEMQPFLSHDLRRVREWAQNEVEVEERESRFFREYEEEDERR